MADRVSCKNKKVTKNDVILDVENEITDIKFDIVDDDDDILIQADENVTYTEEAEEKINETGVDLDGVNFDEDMEDNEAANISIGVASGTCDPADKDYEESGFDYSTGKLWIYPTNYPVRDYQFNIVQQALYKNTLVVLPTGLGKTFIAAVVMYNFYRWFCQGKIVFMAPTKPLVAQQIQACYNIMGIPKADTVEMTGTMAPAARQKAWREKRVVFLTPQVMTNDLSRGSFTADCIKCLVLDEAHKALGNHAYCQVVRELVKFSRQFRVLALSATPGSDLKAVQQVMNNLLISHIELRSEESIDIRPYSHERKLEKIVVPLGEELSSLRLKYIQIMTCTVQRLIRNRVLYNREATKLSKFILLKTRDEFRQNPPQNLQQAQYGNIEADFATAISLYHGFELLQLHGLRSLYNFLTGIIVGEKGCGRTRSELLRNADFNEVMEILRQKFMVSSSHMVSSASGDTKVVVGHPKMQRLEEIVVDHFRSFQSNGEETRVMIFSQYRDSVQEIATILSQHQPLIKVMPFIGQSSAGKTTKGYTQKEQLMVMQKFREGGYNTLVATCVGEEGLDIGDVDLIVCFDAHKSPIRLVQRMGRTGRKRQGRIVMLLSEGVEEQIYKQSLYSKKSIHKAVLNGAKSLHFYPSNPRMIPPSVTPKCHKMYITVASDSDKKAKPLGKSSGLVGNKSKKISDVFGNKVNGVAETAYLTPAEYAEIKKEFAEVSSTAKHLPRPKCITLSAKTENFHNKSKVNASQLIDFAEWMPWQNRLQSTRLVSHSIQSIHLVKTAEFIELLQCIGEEEDHYGREMERLLHEKNIDSVTQKYDGQSSMRSFLTNVHDNSHTTSPKNNVKKVKDTLSSRRQEKKGKPKLRKRKQMVAETITEPVLIESDSSLDEQPKTENWKPELSKLFSELGDHNHKSKAQIHDSVKNGCVKDMKNDLNKTGSLGGRQAAKGKVKPMKKKKQEGAVQRVETEKTKIKRKSILKLLEFSSHNISSTKDDDFEIDFPRGKRSEGWLEDIKEVNTDNEGMQEHNNNAVIDSMTLDIHAVINENGTGNSVREVFLPCAMQSSAVNTQNQGIQELHVNRCLELRQSVDISDTEPFHIPKPPPISEVKELFQRLKSGKAFAELDLEDLMQQWNRFEVKVCKSGKIQNKVFLSHEKQSRPDASLETETAMNNLCSDASRCAEEDTCSKVKHLVKLCGMDELSPQDSRNSLNNSSTAANEIAEDTSKSPLFKSLTNKSLHKNKYSHFCKTGSQEEMTVPEKEKRVKTLSGADHGFSEDSKHNKNTRNHTDTIKNSQHHLKLPMSSESMQKTDSPIEHVSQSKISNTVITRLDETKIDRNVSIRERSLDKFHESFVTFTQALDCLQTSSSDEAILAFDASTPHVSPNKGKVFFGSSRCEIKVPSSDTRQSKVEYADSSHLEQPNLRWCNQDSKFTVQNFSHTGEHILSTVSTTESSKVSLRNFNDDIAQDAYPTTRQKSDHLSFALTEGFIETPIPVSKGSPNSFDLPQFDLGFDLDDDDVIPPTPTKNMSQESVFGFKTLTASSNLSQDIVTCSSLITGDKTSESIKSHQGELLNQHLPASSVCTGTDKSEPLVNNFNLNLLSDEENDGELCKNFREESLKYQILSAESSAKNQHKEEKLCHNVLDFLPLKLGTEKFSKSHEVVPSKTEEGTFGVNVSLLLVESEKDEIVSSLSNLPSTSKSIELPFGRYNNISETDIRTSSADDREFTDKLSTVLCKKSRVGKLKLGKRRQHLLESDYQNNKTRIITSADGNICEPSWVKSCKKSFDDVSENLNHFDKHVSESLNKCLSAVNKMSSSSLNNQLGTRDVCRQTEISTTCMQTSPDASEKPEYVTEVKASTPIFSTSGDGHPIKTVGIRGDSMLELTPIKAHIDESRCASEDSFVVRRRKRVLFPDVSSDLDTKEESASVNADHIGKKNMLSLKQSDSRPVKGMGKSILDEKRNASLLDNFDDDVDDFAGNGSAIVQTKQWVVNKKSQVKKTEMGGEFIEREAVESGDDGSSDENEDMDDFYESSFIDNNTEVTQTQSTDMKAVYLKSIKSSVLGGLTGHYKIQYNNKRKDDMNIFSQTLPEDHGLSEYEEDSFCVGNDEEDVIYDDEDSQLQQHEPKNSRPKIRQHKKEKRRIKVMINTSSEEEKETQIQMTNEFSICPPSKFGRRVLLSSSEDESESKDHVLSSNMESHEARSSEKFCTSLSQENTNTDTVSPEGFNSVEIQNGKQKSEQNSRYIKPAASAHPVLKDYEQAKTEVGNFDLLDEIDWFDDFKVPEETNSSKIVKDKFKCTESNLPSVKIPMTIEMDVLLHNESCNYIHSKSGIVFKLQQGNPSTISTLSSNYTSDRSFCDNSKDLDICSTADNRFNKNLSPHQDTHLLQCGTSVPHTASDIYALCATNNTYSAAVDLLENSQLNINCSKPTFSMTREARLRKQKEKQEMYRKNLKQLQQNNNSKRTSVTDSVASVVVLETDSVIDNARCSIGACDATSRTPVVDSNGPGQTTPPFTKIMDTKRTGHQLQILVDTREISGAQEIISALRLKHSISVTARQLSCCDYILSNHLAADRIQWATFCNSSHRSKLVTRLCEMQALYERCVVVVEADRVKTGQEKSRKPTHHTKYLDTTLCYLAQSKVKVYFTDSVEETAILLADLCRVEQTKGRAINVPTMLSRAKEEVFGFLLSMPKVTVPQALNLAHRFRSIVELLSSPVAVIQERGCMTVDSAQTLHKFLHHKFDSHMIPK